MDAATAEKETVQRMKVRCHSCGLEILCPSEKDMWAWLKCGDVLDFNKAHAGHGDGRHFGAEIETIEKE